MQLISQLSRKVYELEELVLHKGMLVCMTHNKIISNSQVLYSQGSLIIINEYYLDESGKLNSVSIILLPSGVRFYSEIVDS